MCHRELVWSPSCPGQRRIGTDCLLGNRGRHLARLETFPRTEEIGVDKSVALITLAISVLTVFTCGLGSPLSKSGSPVKRSEAEVALTFALLICSGLLIRSFAAMRQVHLGYDPNGVILDSFRNLEEPERPARCSSDAIAARAGEDRLSQPNVKYVFRSPSGFVVRFLGKDETYENDHTTTLKDSGFDLMPEESSRLTHFRVPLGQLVGRQERDNTLTN